MIVMVMNSKRCTIINANLELINVKIHFSIQATFITVDTQPFATKGIP